MPPSLFLLLLLSKCVHIFPSKKGATDDGSNPLTVTFAPLYLPSYDESMRCKDKSPTCVHGRCVNDTWKVETYTCVCFDGWVGDQCDEEVKLKLKARPPSYESHFRCTPNPCLNGGSCYYAPLESSGYDCYCNGHTGRNCEYLCQPPKWGHNCQKTCHGCSDKVCHAVKGCLVCDKPGWTGVPHCDQIDCSSDTPCKNFGYCKKKRASIIPYTVTMKCKCLLMFTGPRCEERRLELPGFPNLCREKEADRCLHGATCRKTVPYRSDPSDIFLMTTDFICLCRPGNFGRFCEYRCVSPHSEHCDNGDCIAISKGKSKIVPIVECQCWPGYNGLACNQECENTWGHQCKQKCGHCADNQPCHHVHGLCPNKHCAPNYNGVRCETRASLLSASSVAQTIAFNIIAYDEFNVAEVSKKNFPPESFIDALWVFISDSYKKYNKTVLDISDVLIRIKTEIVTNRNEAEIVDVKGANAGKKGAISRPKRHNIPPVVVRRINNELQRFKPLSKRDTSAKNAKEYELNFTVTFAGGLKEIKTKGIRSILRKEAGNFNYPGVSIDRTSIKVGKRTFAEVKRAHDDNSNSDRKRLFLIAASVLATVFLFVIVSFSSVRTKLSSRRKPMHKVRRMATPFARTFLPQQVKPVRGRCVVVKGQHLP